MKIAVVRYEEITNKMIGELYADHIAQNKDVKQQIDEDLAYLIENAICGDTSFASIAEAVAELKYTDLAEILEATAQKLKQYKYLDEEEE